MLEIYKELKALKISEQKIGSLDESMSVCETACLDAPIDSASDSFADFIYQSFTWTAKEMNKINRFKQIANDLEVFKEILIRICKENTQLNNLNFEDEMSFVGDFNGWNILIDSITFEITNITDWQFSYYGIIVIIE